MSFKPIPHPMRLWQQLDCNDKLEFACLLSVSHTYKLHPAVFSESLFLVIFDVEYANYAPEISPCMC